jgi:transcriptional regulator with PAS, ATPase and Fis domain
MQRVVKHLQGPPLREIHGIFSRAPEMEEVLRVMQRAARADCTVLLTGETGTGKELAARAIHEMSPRADGAFLARNCATLSPTLLESELFGHVRGAFTGAVREKKGVFALADGGTLLLDEIAETPPEIQGRLLRVLQEKTFVPVGGIKSVSVDVRLISATNKSIGDEVLSGRFRSDLSYRIRVVPITLPALRDRTGDPEALFWHFIDEQNAESSLRRVEAVHRDVLEIVRSYAWPGNIRELQNAVEYAFVVGEGPTLRPEELPAETRGELPPDESMSADGGPGLIDERERIVAALEQNGWRRAEAAEALGMSRSTLWRKIRELRLTAPRSG